MKFKVYAKDGSSKEVSQDDFFQETVVQFVMYGTHYTIDAFDHQTNTITRQSIPAPCVQVRFDTPSVEPPQSFVSVQQLIEALERVPVDRRASTPVFLGGKTPFRPIRKVEVERSGWMEGGETFQVVLKCDKRTTIENC